MKKRSILTSSMFAAASLSLLAPALPSAALAQSAGLEEIVVTAQKREESLQDTPISIVALGPAQLENLGISDINDLGSNIPNLQITPHSNSGAIPRIFIRGVGNFDDQITQDPSVAVYMDGVYVGRNQGMGVEVADIERIEVLRGPQGILYGRNATGGAINFITRAPGLEQWGFSQQLTFGRRDEFRSRTMLNVPVGDTFAARLFYLDSSKDGFVRNTANGEDTYGGEDRDAQRIDLLFRPNDAVDIRYAFDRSKLEDSPFYLAGTTPGVAPQRPSTSHDGNQLIKPSDITTMGHQVTINWQLHDGLTLRSITAYRDLDSYVYQDYLSGTGRPNTPLFIDNDVDQDQWSQELQLLGSALDGRLEYILGAYYFEEQGDGQISTWLPNFGIRQYSDTDTENKAAAVFGQGTYTPVQLDQRLHITLGARWSKDDRQAELERYNQLLVFNNPGDFTDVSPGFILPASVQNGAGDQDFDHVSPALTVTWDLNDSANIYAKVVEGYKTGGFNIRASTIAFFENGFDPETLISYEAGIKSQWLDNRLRANLAVFRAEYDDIQINAQSDISDPSKSDVLNAGKATINGAELELSAMVAEGLVLSLQYGYLDAGYDKIIDGLGQNVTNNFAFINAPENSYTLDATYDIARTCIGQLIANLNYTWQDDKYSSVSTNFGEYTIDDYGLLNARLTLDEIPGLSKGYVKAAIWGKNITDEEYSFINAPGFGTYRAWGEPRSYGLDLTYQF
ncbi:MAG: TonB-dependent receptor [Gammaproteobacteria bacterium]|nr:TonB-dependent receptor [Gammaproteobacteria bacterium]MBK8306397.1 TonB-dependent receptor [Gammaproteobacteria bacterium]